MEEIYDNWLHNPGIADSSTLLTGFALKDTKPSPKNEIYIKTMREVQKWRKRNSVYLKQKKERTKFDFTNYDSLISEQQILLLENMLDESVVNQHTLKDLNDFFTFSVANAEVQHRWFELVVKYKYKQSYEELKQFLTNHLAMGVYLFGEMIFSDDSSLQRMAEESYSAMKEEMEPNYISTIDQMLHDIE